MPSSKKTRRDGNARTTKSRDDEQPGSDAEVEASPSGEAGSRFRGKRKTSSSDIPKTKVSTEESPSRPHYSHWLMKSEPNSRFENGIDVKARNFMRDMKEGQLAFFYHSNCKEPGIVAIIKVVKEAYVDHTQFDKKDVHYDPSSKPNNPKWSMVDVCFERMMKRFIPLSELKEYHLKHKAEGGPLKDMAQFTTPRLSVQPLTAEAFDFVLSLENKDRC